MVRIDLLSSLFTCFFVLFFLFFIQGKIQKHQTFEAELAAHSNVIHTLKSTGKNMIDQRHFALAQIKVSRDREKERELLLII